MKSSLNYNILIEELHYLRKDYKINSDFEYNFNCLLEVILKLNNFKLNKQNNINET